MFNQEISQQEVDKLNQEYNEINEYVSDKLNIINFGI